MMEIWENATTKGPRKAWDDEFTPPEGEGWVVDPDRGNNGWERFDYHEERYWKRLVSVEQTPLFDILRAERDALLKQNEKVLALFAASKPVEQSPKVTRSGSVVEVRWPDGTILAVVGNSAVWGSENPEGEEQ